MKKSRAAVWLAPSIADILFLGLLYWLLRNGSRLLNDGDTGWHLVTGENILRTFKIPYADPYSHSMPGTPWTAHEWLGEVIFALFHRWMGLNGPVLLSAAVVAATFFFLYKFMLYRKVNAIIAILLTTLAAWTSMLHWLARPHIFSFLLTLAFFVILEMHQREKRDYLKFLPLLMVLWVNLHGGYILGIILVLLYAGGNLLTYFTMPKEREGARKNLKSLAIAAIATLLATFLNPRGPAILYFPFNLVGREYIMDNVVEWRAPDFHKYVIFEVMLLLYITIFVLSRRKPDIFEGCVALLLTHMALYSVRYIPLAAIILSPMAAVRAGKVLDRITQYASNIKPLKGVKEGVKNTSENVSSLEARPTRHLLIYITLAICFAVALNGGRIGNARVMDFKHDKKRFPVDALNFAIEHHIAGKMFNNDGWGGYIIYRGYPQYMVFIDGRSDMYGVPFLKEYVQVARAQIDYEQVLDKYEVSWIIFNANSPTCQLLAANPKWTLVYADTTANIIVKNIPENRQLIDRFKYAEFVPESVLDKPED
jgi:hypothetical protein